jgi:hypothetical protein
MRLLTIPSDFRSKTLAIGLLAAVALLMPAFAASAGASSITIYSNPLKSLSQRSEIQQKGRGVCDRRPTKAAIRFRLGKRTTECRYLVPVAGRDLEVAATGRIFPVTPRAVRSHVYLGLGLRQAAGPSRYEFAVFPSGRRYQLRRILPGGKLQVLARGTSAEIGGFGKANRMVFRAYNGVVADKPSYAARLVGIVNGKVIAVADVARGNLVAGQDTSMSISSNRNATGAFGSFTGIRVRMPSPF